MKKYPPHKIIFKDQANSPHCDAYDPYLAAELAPNSVYGHPVIYISQDEMQHSIDRLEKIIVKLEEELGLCGEVMEKDRLRIEYLEEICERVYLDGDINRLKEFVK